MVHTLFSHFRSWLISRKAATGIEYALIATGICLAIAVTVYAFGDELQALYENNLSDALSG